MELVVRGKSPSPSSIMSSGAQSFIKSRNIHHTQISQNQNFFNRLSAGLMNTPSGKKEMM